MSLNCNEINLILSELNATFGENGIKGSFIQEIVQPGFDTIAFRLFKNGESHTLLVCTSSSGCRLNEVRKKIPKNTKPLRFNEFLKSRIKGSKIIEAKQLGLERIVKFSLLKNGEENLFLYVRLWSGAANIIVTDSQNKILDCMFRRPAKGEVTGGIFFAEEKKLTEEEKNTSLKKFPVRQYDTSISFNQFIDDFYSEHASALSRENLLSQAEKWYNQKYSRMSLALKKLEEKLNSFSSAEKLKHTGDLILAFSSDIKNSALDCIDYDTNSPVHIKLDSKLNPQENAAIYYEQYKKSLSGRQSLEHDIELSKKSLIALEAEYKAMLEETNVLKLEQLLRKDTRPKQKDTKPHAGLHYEVDGWTIIVGRTASENDDLLRHTVKGSDLWMHTRDYAGGYVFVKARSGKTVPLEIMLYAGNLAVYHSKARKNGQADLYYTQVKYLRRAKNGPKGLVLPTHEKNILVKIDNTKMQHLDEIEKSSQLI